MSINLMTVPNYNNNQPSFKGKNLTRPTTFISLSARAAKGVKKSQQIYDRFIEKLTEKVVAPIMNSKLVSKIADKTVNIENMTDHMATAGSFVTTATYAGTTLNNKKLEKKPARTLALNQLLVTTLSTIGAYTINNGVANFTKKMSYKFSDANQHLPTAKLNNRMQGFKIAQKLLTFTLMYRYVAPVLVTPVASKIGKALNSNDKCFDKKELAKNIGTTVAINAGINMLDKTLSSPAKGANIKNFKVPMFDSNKTVQTTAQRA